DEPCPGGQQFQDCGGPCGRSCSEPPGAGHCPTPDTLCAPGCRCPPGLLLAQGGQCVPP
ncbi:SSPO protein, partial [Formicarius rufipectus]|nr:SSPO protein [Formicarius rufipectus]